MRVLGSSVLAMEVIIVLLAWALAQGLYPDSNQGLVLGLVLALEALLILAIAMLRKPWGVTLGWILQVAVLALGFLVPTMFIIGGIFVVLWFFAVRNGQRVDALRAERAAEADK
jgi:nitrogen fixation-related uncharacterized protein